MKSTKEIHLEGKKKTRKIIILLVFNMRIVIIHPHIIIQGSKIRRIKAQPYRMKRWLLKWKTQAEKNIRKHFFINIIVSAY